MTDTFGAPSSARPTSDTELRERARERVAAAARRGDPPSTFPADDIVWAFEGHEDELQACERQAEQAREAKTETDRRRAREDEVRSLADQIESSWLKQEREERRARAVAEARRQLGLEPA